MTLAAAPAEPELMVGHAPKLGKKHHHEQNEGYGSFFCTTWIKDGKSFRMINFAIMRGHLIIILTCVCVSQFTSMPNLLSSTIWSSWRGFFCFFLLFFWIFFGVFFWIGIGRKSNIVFTAVLYYSFGCLLRIPTKYYKYMHKLDKYIHKNLSLTDFLLNFRMILDFEY